MDSVESMVTAVFQHALAHYEEDGWDYVVECWSAQDIEEAIEHSGAQTCAEAIDVIHCDVKIRDDYRKDIEATAW